MKKDQGNRLRVDFVLTGFIISRPPNATSRPQKFHPIRVSSTSRQKTKPFSACSQGTNNSHHFHRHSQMGRIGFQAPHAVLDRNITIVVAEAIRGRKLGPPRYRIDRSLPVLSVHFWRQLVWIGRKFSAAVSHHFQRHLLRQELQ